MVSISCLLIRRKGFSEVIGSWKIIEICPPRSLRTSLALRPSTLLPR